MITAARFRLLSALLALIWMATLFYLSSQASIGLPLEFDGGDKLAHMAAYGLLASFMLGACARSSSGYSLRQVALVTLLASLYGLSDEWHQSFVPGRSADVLDLLADSLGAALTALLLRLWLRKRLQRDQAV